MQVERMKLGVIRANAKNPRTISTTKFEQLVDSILIFPRMLELRPIVIDASNVALGGNMRKRSLDAIVKMKPADIKERLEGIADYQKLADDERATLNKYWAQWVSSPDVPVVKADTLTESQKRQFIIKDNVAFGQWDWDALANDWDDKELGDWGVDVWHPEADAANNEVGGADVHDANPDDYGEDFTLKDEDKTPFTKTTFTLSDEQQQAVEDALKEAKHTEEYKYIETFGNSNSNGNALYLIVTQWIGQRK